MLWKYVQSCKKGVTREISDSITKLVNFYDDHYQDRFQNLEVV